MNDFPLLLASKDLFLSISTHKIKTLKQAEQLLKQKDPPRAKQIKDLIQTFNKIGNYVENSFNSMQNYVDLQEPNIFDDQNPLQYYYFNPSIIEVIGYKGSGKTSLVLNLVIQYIQNQKSDKVFLLNCSGGITYLRFQSIAKYKVTYFDIFTVQELQESLKNFVSDGKPGLVIIDGVYSLLIGSSLKNRLGEVFTQLRANGWSIIFTNLIQGKLEMQQKEVLNAMAYFPNTFGGISDCRLSISPEEDQESHYRIRALKILNNRKYQFLSVMNSSGLSKLQLLKF